MSSELKKRNIPFSPPDMSELEVEEVADCLRSGWITTGPRTKRLEKELAAYIGVGVDTPNCVCLNSATASEELSLRILGIRPGDEVIVPAYTYTSSAAAAIHVGAKVIFVDSQEDSLEHICVFRDYKVHSNVTGYNLSDRLFRRNMLRDHQD